MNMKADRPVRGVFVAWDEEEVTVERRDAGTVHDRTVAVARRTVTKYALWSNAVTPANIDAAERYVACNQDEHDNMRVEVFSGKSGNTRRYQPAT
jgi:hypothetical protein